jgi:hypothetical protein
MQTTLTINELRLEFKSEMSRLPDWMTGTLPLHHLIWQTMDILNETLLQLIVNKVLTTRTINKIINDFEESITLIIDNVKEDMQIKVAIYYTSMVDYLEFRTLEEEQYEACSNLKKFSDYYFKNSPTP